MSDIDGRPIRVLGMGNVLMGDDALGPTVARVLNARYELPPRVEVHDVGTPGLDLTPYVCDADAVIVVDTVHGEGPPGSIRIVRSEELLGIAPPPRTSPHQPGLREAMMAAELTDSTPGELIVIGVVPSSTETGTGLSAAVAAAVEGVLREVIDQLEGLGAPAVARRQPGDPDLWWERRPGDDEQDCGAEDGS